MRPETRIMDTVLPFTQCGSPTVWSAMAKAGLDRALPVPSVTVTENIIRLQENVDPAQAPLSVATLFRVMVNCITAEIVTQPTYLPVHLTSHAPDVRTAL